MRFFLSPLYRNKLLKLLRIRSDETKPVSLVMLYALSIGAMQNLVIAVPLALFLARYNTSILPYIYIGTAIATIFAGMFFSYFQKRISLEALLKGTLISLAITLVLLWGIFVIFNYPWITVILVMWGAVISSFGSLILGCMTNQLFSLKQGKRIYGLFSAGQGIGGIISGLSLPLLVHVIGTQNVILIIAMILSGTLWVQWHIKQLYAERLNVSVSSRISEDTGAKPISFLRMLKKPYIVTIFSLVALGIFGYLTLDLLFNTLAKQRYVSEVKLASFLGIFTACNDGLNIIVGSFVFGWILEKLGVIAALAFLPLTVALLIIAAYMTHLIPAAIALVFWIIVLARLFEETFSTTVNEQSILLLFQPLNPAEKIWVTARKETIIAPLATGLIGIFLLYIDKRFGINLHYFAYILLIIYAVMAVLLLALRSQYLKELLTALTKHALVKPKFERIDKYSLKFLQGYLQSRFPEEVIYALDTMKQANFEEFVKELQIVLNDAVPEVKYYALENIEQHRISELASQVQAISTTETDSNILEEAYIALAAVGGEADLQILIEHINSNNLALRSGAIIGLLKYGSAELYEKAFVSLTNWVVSRRNEERFLAAHAVQRINTSQCKELMLPLLQDPDLKVRSAACTAVAGFRQPILYPILIENLWVPEVGNSAFASLLDQGDDLIDFIAEHFEQYSIDLKCQLIKLLGNMQDPRANLLLVKYLDLPNKQIQHTTLLALRLQHYHVDDANKPMIREHLYRELDCLTMLQNILSVISLTNQTQILYGLLAREIALGQERIFLWLTFIYPVAPILTARDGFVTHKEDMVSYAEEVVIRTLEVNDIEKVLPVLSFHMDSHLHEEGSDAEQRFLQALDSLINQAQDFYLSGIKSAIIYTIVTVRIKSFYDQIKNLVLIDEGDEVLQETYDWARGKCNAKDFP